MNSKLREQWEEVLNPDVQRARLISASIYIATFESLKDTIITKIRDFFSIGFGEDEPMVDPKYAAEVLTRKGSRTYASLDWLLGMGAVDLLDIEAFDRIKKVRNALAHRLLEVLCGEGLPVDFDARLQEMVELMRKIGVWWIVNVEIPTNPDFDGETVNEEEIIPGSILGFQMICQIALEGKTYLYDAFRDKAGVTKPEESCTQS